MASNSPYRGKPRTSFWKASVSGRSPDQLRSVTHDIPSIAENTKIMTAGSCFAQHIATRLKTTGFTVLDYEPAPGGTSRDWQLQHGFGTYSARYGNIYFVRQLLQLLQEAEGVFSPQDWIWKSGDRYYDALRPSVEPAGHPTQDSVRQHRTEHLAAVRRLVRDADLFVFTLGLTEGWEHIESGTVYPTAPGTIAGDWDPTAVRFHNFSFLEIQKDLMAVIEHFRNLNPKLRILLTVSPVALAATATENHVLVANSYSKSVLRAVAGEITDSINGVFYFPSFDMITGANSGDALFAQDQRQVRQNTVDFVMQRFVDEILRSAYPEMEANVGQPNQAPSSLPEDQRRERQICEDSLLEDFSS